MKQVAGYVADYFLRIHRLHFLLITLALGTLIWFNYHYGLTNLFLSSPSFNARFIWYYALFAGTFIVTWISGLPMSPSGFPKSLYFYLLIVLSPAVFALKVVLQIKYVLVLHDNVLTTILQWPLKAGAVVIMVFLLWTAGGNRTPLAGMSAKNFNARPYFLLLACMLPLLLLAGKGNDFQAVYPKLQMIGYGATWLQKLFFELCYGLDFFTIELFFRGFLVITFIKYAGDQAILPMAAFYCTIHFGKPVAECISSYFGGLILGAVVYRTHSIWGGLIVHLGIAWLMEGIGLIF